jgi:hypothetical protein
MELKPIQKSNKYNVRSPTLQTVLMVEGFIKEHSGEYKKTEIFENLPKKVMWNTFQVIMSYLEESLRILVEKDGKITYIWNPKFYEKIKDRPEIKV